MTSNLLFRFKWHFAKSKNVKIVHYRHQQKNFFSFFPPKSVKSILRKRFFSEIQILFSEQILSFQSFVSIFALRKKDKFLFLKVKSFWLNFLTITRGKSLSRHQRTTRSDRRHNSPKMKASLLPWHKGIMVAPRSITLTYA